MPRDGNGVAEERERLKRALESVSEPRTENGSIAAELAAAHRAILEDPDLVAHANEEIRKGRSAAFAWRSACDGARETICATGDTLLIERAADLLDIERRVIAVLVDAQAIAVPQLAPISILVAPDLLPLFQNNCADWA